MHLYTTVIASVTITALATFAEAHSWIECTDWRFNNPKKVGWLDKDGKCHGYARQFPLGFEFGILDGPPKTDKYSGLRNRHHEQDPKKFVSCSQGGESRTVGQDETRQSPVTKAYGGKYGNMASVKAGDTTCIRWPAKNHAVENEKDRGVFINMPQTLLNKDPSQSEFTKANLVKLDYKNCTFISNTDRTPCGGCFQIPPTLKTGIYVVQWRWELNDNEWYTSCWDIGVTAPVKEPIINNNGTNTNNGNNTVNDNNPMTSVLDGSTSIFAELAEF